MRDRVKKLLGQSGIKRRFMQRTFPNFRQDTPGRRKNFKIAKEYADNFSYHQARGDGLYIEGTNGTGKTHLAAAIALQLIHEGVPVICKTSSDLLLDIKKSFDGDGARESDVLDIYKKVDLLIIDDLGKEQCSDWSMSTLYSILNDRYEDMKPTIVTTNYSESGLIAALTPGGQHRYDDGLGGHTRQRGDAAMNKYEKIYHKAKGRSHGSEASWLDSAIAALAVDLEEHTGEEMEVGGPYGLRAEVIISSNSRILIITPDFEDGNLKLYYNTGEKTEKHQPNTLEEIVSAMTQRTGTQEELELGEIIVTKQWASDGWVRGRIGKYSFSAKVYGAPSAQYGIDKGRVSKLSIREEAGKRPVVNYDRGWDIRPEGKRVEKIFRKILAFLEAIPLPGSEDK